ncbi:MAG: SH3 domain-containing protein [Candidatus Aminicenantes bacterium]|nr:SH3 domain-containing protein [Candidatus Aminicenantes bacterium]
MKKSLVIAAVLLSSVMILSAATAGKVRVTVHNANVRSQPSLAGEIVLKAGMGDVFEVTGKSGGWFKVALPAEAGAREGYINEAVVETVTAGETAKAAAKPRPEPPPPPRPAKTAKPVPAPAKAAAPEKLFAGLALKFGIQTTPAADFADRWLLALTYEKGINPFLAAGVEIQPYFRSYSDAEFSASTLGANLFLNAKGGVNLGRFTEKLKFLTPYAGFGLGPAFAFSNSKAGAEKASSADFRFAWHLLFGFEVTLKKLGLIYEIQILKVSVAETDPDLTQYFMMVGVRF